MHRLLVAPSESGRCPIRKGMAVARLAFVTYAGTVEGFRRFGLPELRRAGMRGWTLASHADRIQDGLDRAEDAETAWSARRWSKAELAERAEEESPSGRGPVM